MVLTKMGQGIIVDLISKNKAMYGADTNALSGGKLILQFVEKMSSMCKNNLKLLKRFPILSQKHIWNFARNIARLA